MGLWNVLTAAGASWVFGVIWYRVMSSHRSSASYGGGRPVGIDRVTILIASALVLVIVAGFLRHLFFVSGLTSSVPLGLVAGMGVGLFFIAPWIWLTNLADGRPFGLVVIDGGFATLATAIMGALLVAF